ncbi:MAG: ATP-grasp domain-containing protein [Methylomonas sp.]|jgi:biotin carboxylase|uniref:ATP-grasp domain-containing protein n=1 Tax=Methylomonas sp. TaxID=418 RepID=UPI0025DF5945|nr:ATP-grasp domain-containing protein [Methylomonas sp.]MCK9605232.1 ATP-grasp domain-containing protein [Methylomonas sp.]
MKQKLMIIGAGREQVPAIINARKLGYATVVTDINQQAPGFAYADYSEVVSTADFDGNLHVARQYQIHGIMTLGSEVAVPIVAKIARILGLPAMSEETALKATNKNAMRAAFKEFGVPSPVSEAVKTLVEAENFANQFGYPLVIKPSNSSGQRGVEKIGDWSVLCQCFDEAIKYSTDGYAIVETFYAGPEINVTAAVVAGQITVLSLSNRVTAASPHFGIAVEHVFPPDISAQQASAVKAASILAIKAIGLKNGIAYPQVVVGNNGAQVIEIAARIPGGFMREVGLYMSGIDMIDVAIKLAMGCVFSLNDCVGVDPVPALSVRFMTELDYPIINRPVADIVGTGNAKNSPGILLVDINAGIGRLLPSLNSSAARFGAIIAQGQDRDEARRNSAAALSKISIQFVDT